MYTHSRHICISFSTNFLLPFLLLLLLLRPVQGIAQSEPDYISYDEFYQGLAPYGQWIEDIEYGYVWLPGEDINFRPYYTNGHWLMTDYGNTWVSDYVWGWACFHYGRWTYDKYYGWLWIPGSEWAPAWVSWRYGEGFYGWAPLSPGTGAEAATNNYNCPGDWWVFLPPKYLYSGNYYRFWYGPRDNKHLIENSGTIVNKYVNGNTTYITGPHAAQVRRVSGSDIEVYKTRNSNNHNTRVHGGEVRMFRPAHIPRVSAKGGANPPPNVMAAPKPVGQPGTITANSGAVPPFRERVISRNNAGLVTPGTDVNPTAEPQTQKSTSNPYEWDVSRSVKQEYTPPPKPAAPKPAPAKPKRTVSKHPRAAQPPARESQQKVTPSETKGH